MKKTISLLLSLVMIFATLATGGLASAEAAQTATVTPSEMYLTVYNGSTYSNTMQTCYERVTFAKFDFTGLREQLQNATKIYVHLKTMYSDATFGNFRIVALKQEHEAHIGSGMSYSSADTLGAVGDVTYQLYRVDGAEAVGEKSMAIEVDKTNLLKALETGTDDILGLRFDRFDWGGANTQFYPGELKITFEYMPVGYGESSVTMTSGGMLVEGSPDDVNWGGLKEDDNGKIQYMNDRKGYVLFDLSAYEAELYGATEIKLIGACANASWWDLYSFNVYALSDGAEQYLKDDCNYTNAAKYVWNGGTLCATGDFELSADNFEIPVNKEALLAALESGTNGVVALRFEPKGDGTTNSFLKNDVTLNIIYDTTSDSYKNYMYTRVNNLLWSGVSSQAQNRVYKDIVLPSQLAGQNITWSSGNEAVIKSNGEVINGNTLQTATLTATVGEYSKAFELVVTPEFYVDTPIVKVEEETAEIVFASYNAADSANDYVAIIAVYEGEELKSVHVEDIESIAGEATIKPYTMTNICNKYNVKAFAWNNIDDAVPLCINAK